MSIRFTCAACPTVLKIPEMINESKKVRCTGCGIVLIVEPDPDNDDGVIATVAKRTPKPKQGAGASNQMLLFAGAALVLLLLMFGLWWFYGGPSDRAAIEGNITLDDVLLEGGTITFKPMDDSSKEIVTGPINARGHYSFSASRGPAIGRNRVEIYGGDNKTVAAAYNTASTLVFDVQKGANTKDFSVKSR